jgi:hypothetical protein
MAMDQSKVHLFPMELSIFPTLEYYITLTKDISEEKNKAELRKNVKQVIEIIVNLLKDRVDVEKEYF